MSPRLTQLHKLHAADPRDPFLTYGIALEHAKAGQLDDALAWLDKTLAADRKYCYAYFQKAKMLSEKGDDDGAKATLHEGIRVAREAGDEHAGSEMMQLLESMA
jgi:tetratricopeptide (TPR) repeat protein